MLLIFFLIGLAVGSFLNVVILRMRTGESVRGRSRCMSCLHKLGWYDLVPLLSYFAIRGHCRHCGSRISVQYPLVELLTGALFLITAYSLFGSSGFSFEYGLLVRYVLSVSFFSVLIAASIYDIRHKIIPDEFSMLLFSIAIVFEAVVLFTTSNPIASELLNAGLSSILAFGFFAGLWYFSKGTWMGFGDAKLALSLGLFLGYPAILVGAILSFWIGALVGIAFLISGVYTRKTEVPFAPYLAMGSFVAYLLIAGDYVSWYYEYISIV